MINIKSLLLVFGVSIIFILAALPERSKIKNESGYLTEEMRRRLKYLDSLLFSGIAGIFVCLYYTYKYFLGS